MSLPIGGSSSPHPTAPAAPVPVASGTPAPPPTVTPAIELEIIVALLKFIAASAVGGHATTTQPAHETQQPAGDAEPKKAAAPPARTPAPPKMPARIVPHPIVAHPVAHKITPHPIVAHHPVVAHKITPHPAAHKPLPQKLPKPKESTLPPLYQKLLRDLEARIGAFAKMPPFLQGLALQALDKSNLPQAVKDIIHHEIANLPAPKGPQAPTISSTSRGYVFPRGYKGAGETTVGPSAKKAAPTPGLADLIGAVAKFRNGLPASDQANFDGGIAIAIEILEGENGAKPSELDAWAKRWGPPLEALLPGLGAKKAEPKPPVKPRPPSGDEVQTILSAVGTEKVQHEGWLGWFATLYHGVYNDVVSTNLDKTLDPGVVAYLKQTYGDASRTRESMPFDGVDPQLPSNMDMQSLLSSLWDAGQQAAIKQDEKQGLTQQVDIEQHLQKPDFSKATLISRYKGLYGDLARYGLVVPGGVVPGLASVSASALNWLYLNDGVGAPSTVVKA